MVAGGITIAALALIADGLLALVQRRIVSPGVSGRSSPNPAFSRGVIRIHVTAQRPSPTEGHHGLAYQGGR